MYTIDLFSVNDIFNVSLVNLDYKTESYNFDYYLYYFFHHSEDNFVIRKNDNIGYILGKHEGSQKNYHGHVTALSIAPDHRRSGIGKTLMCMLEHNGNCNKAYFVDLFVRSKNEQAIKFYTKMGYVVYRTIIDYYEEPKEDAYEMRKGLSIDIGRDSMVPYKSAVHANELLKNSE